VLLLPVCMFACISTSSNFVVFFQLLFAVMGAANTAQRENKSLTVGEMEQKHLYALRVHVLLLVSTCVFVLLVFLSVLYSAAFFPVSVPR